MGTFYHELYGLSQRPFALTPDPDFLFPAEPYREALDRLTYGIEEGLGFLVLTGEVGTGKTTLVHTLLARLPANFKTAYLMNPILTFEEILAALQDDLGVTGRRPGEGKGRQLHRFNQFLLEMHAAGQEVVVVIDEAQNLSPQLLEELRMLSNLETSKAKLLHLILVGQPELGAILDAPGLRQLRQRIGVQAVLRALNQEETGSYIAHRLQRAGARTACRFSPEAVEAVHRRSGGIPRLINQVCHAALVAGYVSGATLITRAMVEQGARELVTARVSENEAPVAVRVPWARRVLQSMAILAFAALLGLALVLAPGGLN